MPGVCYTILSPASAYLDVLGVTPGANRTRDLLLRRQLLYPLSYRGGLLQLYRFLRFG